MKSCVAEDMPVYQEGLCSQRKRYAACAWDGRYKKFVRNSAWDTEGKKPLGNPGIDERIVLK